MSADTNAIPADRDKRDTVHVRLSTPMKSVAFMIVALAQPSQALPTIESRLHLGSVAHAKLRVCSV